MRSSSVDCQTSSLTSPSATKIKKYRPHLPKPNWRRCNVSQLLACCLVISTVIETARAATLTVTETASTAAAAVTVSATTSDQTAKAMAAVMPSAANRKRVTLRSVDPLTRRSTVEKHFIRFGRNELEDDDGLSSPSRTPINLRKREVFQDATVAAKPRQFFVDENSPPTYGDADIEQPRILLADCWSPSDANSGNRTRACLGRLRLRQHNHNHPFRSRHKQQQNRNVANDDNVDFDSDNNNAAAAFSKSDIGDSNQFVAVNDENDFESDSAGGDIGVRDDDDDGNGRVQDAEYAPRTNNASNGGAFFIANTAPISVSGASAAGTSPFLRADWKKATMDGDRDTFVRTSRNKFSRNLFSRYDRGRDNFMRLGRSKLAEDASKEKTLPPPFVDDDNEDDQYDHDDANQDGDGDDQGGAYVSDDASWSRTKRNGNSVQRFPRKHDSFMRLGRKHDSNFMRLGRTQIRSGSQFIRYGRNGPPSNGDYDRWTRKHDNFMRLGRDQRPHPPQQRYRQSKREKAQNFMRLGRQDGHLKPQQIRRSAAENFMRFGRRTVANYDNQNGWNVQRSPSPLLTLSRFRRQTWLRPDSQSANVSRIATIANGRGLEQTAAAAAASLQPWPRSARWIPDRSPNVDSSSSSYSTVVIGGGIATT